MVYILFHFPSIAVDYSEKYRPWKGIGLVIRLISAFLTESRRNSWLRTANSPTIPSKPRNPPPKKLEEARKKGQVALSREVNNWVMLLAATILIVSFTGPVFKDITLLMQTYIERSHDIPGAPGGLYIALGEGLKKILLILALPFALLMLAAFLSPFVQVGPLFAPR